MTQPPFSLPPTRISVEFRWEHQASTWGPFTKMELAQMMIRIAGVLRISPKEAQQIRVVFGDHIVISRPDQPDWLNTACCLTEFHDNGDVLQITVVLNRSLQVALDCVSNDDDDEQTLHANLETEEELLYWLLIEELHHARLNVRSKTRDRLDQWKAAYREYVLRRGIVSRDPYAFDLEEVAASRVAVLRLADLIPDRAAYFHSLYQESLARCVHIIPSITQDLARRAYVDMAE